MTPPGSSTRVEDQPCSVSSTAYVVTGFYTPNYTALAQKFVAYLNLYGVPHHLYPVPAAEWQNAILLKAQIIQRAMAQFPNRTVVLMDIDCRLKGSIAPIIEFNGDISLFVSVRDKFQSMTQKYRQQVVLSSRVMVCHQTQATQRLLENWENLCRVEKSSTSRAKNDENLLMNAISITNGLSLNVIDPRYSGRDPAYAPKDAIVIHYSAHHAARAAADPRVSLKTARRRAVSRIVSRLIGKPYKQWKYDVAEEPEPVEVLNAVGPLAPLPKATAIAE